MRVLIIALVALLISCGKASDRPVGTVQVQDREIQFFTDSGTWQTGPQEVRLSPLPGTGWVMKLTANEQNFSFPVSDENNSVTIILPDVSEPITLQLIQKEIKSSALNLLLEEEVKQVAVFYDNDKPVFIVIEAPVPSIYGNHPFQFMVYSLEKNGLIPTHKYDFRFRPWMQMNESYGHSSNFNEQPVAGTDVGSYEGKITYSMPGVWELQFTVSKEGAEIAKLNRKVTVIRK